MAPLGLVATMVSTVVPPVTGMVKAKFPPASAAPDAAVVEKSPSVLGTADAGGSFAFTIPVTGGTTVLTIVATSASGATAHVTRTVVYDFVPGTQLLDVTDPSNDDNGPGNYAYPTSSNFHAGAYDLQRFQVYDDGTNIIFRVQTRDLTPTFGSPLGAQLVDVYVHNPSAATTSTAASFPQRNYTIDATVGSVP